ncbi:hypothetical protein [Variovorax gossypii]|jgi:hypothetical protein
MNLKSLRALHTRYRRHGGQPARPLVTWLDWESLGSMFGIVGAFLLAVGLGAGYTRLGWLCFLGSNLSWLAFARAKGFNKLQLQTLAFMASTLLGIYRSFFGGSP